ncbi:uncharacterized protein LOC128881967, partial [Hylaeus volcanicus]|uniref:uncharacterized protein LOC128881967 n=1 Tax=Hylaeus volcanicus TaxID=313075 RepID=UPI0023B8743B
SSKNSHGKFVCSRGTVEIRRNPIRVTKKNPDKDFPRPRQRLLSTKRKEMLSNQNPSKRGKSSTMPYMNTRSVTRKMYNVGATYQAPSVSDEMEWKEWPVHGMHERPVFHPQFGLAAEYLGRWFTSIDDSYHEIVDHPDVEVVSVDPRCDFLLSSTEKKRSNKGKTSRSSKFSAKTPSSGQYKKHKSFETCMHESFHCVLGYCSQVVTSGYKSNVEGKIIQLNDEKNVSKKQQAFAASVEQVADLDTKQPLIPSRNNPQKPVEESKSTDNCAFTRHSRNSKNYSQTLKTHLYPAQKVYVANPQKTVTFGNLKSYREGQLTVHKAIELPKKPQNLGSLEARDAQMKTTPTNANAIQLEESIGYEPLTDASSTENSKVEASKPAKHPKKAEFRVTKYLLDSTDQNKVKISKEMTSTSSNKTWCSNDTSQIAKILSEYNKSSTKKPAIENQGFCTTMRNIRDKETVKKEEQKQSTQENSSDRSANVKFPQGKWRRFHLTVEKVKSNPDEKKLSSGMQHSQSLTKEDPRYLETFQRIQPNATSLERKENVSTNENAVIAPAKTDSLQELMENTAMLYCAATGTHQDDLAIYIDSLDVAKTMQWLETCKHLFV